MIRAARLANSDFRTVGVPMIYSAALGFACLLAWLITSFFMAEVPLSLVMLLVLLATATATDCWDRKIYNWTTYFGVCFAGVASLIQSLRQTPTSLIATVTFPDYVVGLGVCFAVGLIAQAFTHGGAGDVKLKAAIGALVGFQDGLWIIAWAYLLAGFLAASAIFFRLGPRRTFWTIFAIFRGNGSRLNAQLNQVASSARLPSAIPMAPFLAIAGVIVVFL